MTAEIAIEENKVIVDRSTLIQKFYLTLFERREHGVKAFWVGDYSIVVKVATMIGR